MLSSIALRARLSASVVVLALAASAGCAAPAAEPEQAASAQRTSAACAATRARLDEAARKAPRDGTYDAVLAFSSAECGRSFHTAGPSQLGADRLVRIGSVTKTYVAVATLQSVAAGRIDLDRPIDRYLSDLPPAVGPVTVRQLLQHTSGIFSYTSTSEFWAAIGEAPLQSWTPDRMVALAASKPPYFAPGAGWQYSNTNYVLLGMLLEEVEGAPVATLVRTRILEPNGLGRTFLEGSEPLEGTLAPGFDTSGADVSDDYSLSWAWAAGAMAATPDDAARFLELVATGALLPPDLQSELTRGVPTPQPGLQYGLGVFLVDGSLTGGAGRGIGHGGDIMGFHSIGLYFPDAKMTLFGAVNSDKGTGNDVLAAALRQLYAPAPPSADGVAGEARARAERR